MKLLQENPSISIEIYGHTDNVGSESLNLKLSEERAASVKDYLAKNGIKSKRLNSKGFGKEKPIATNDTEEGRQINRRVEFVVVTK